MEPVGESDLKAIQKKCTRSPAATTQWNAWLDEDDLREHLPTTRTRSKSSMTNWRTATARPSTAGDGMIFALARTPTTATSCTCPTSVSTAYWRGDQDREQLVRIYGLVEPSRRREGDLRTPREAKKRDHRELGKELRLFHVDEEVGQGLILWTLRGVIRQELQDFISHHLEGRATVRCSRPTLGRTSTAPLRPLPLLSGQPVSAWWNATYEAALHEGCTWGELSNMMSAGDIEGYLPADNCPPRRSTPRKPAPTATCRCAGRIHRLPLGTVGRNLGHDPCAWLHPGRRAPFRDRGPNRTGSAGLHRIADHLQYARYGRLPRSRGPRDPDSTKYVGDPARWDKAERVP